jgi:uncharacterized protein YfaS (alpha-2-macroglobulin family)
VPVDFVLPKTAPRGRWRAVLEMEGLEDPAGELSFAVEDFAPQRLAVTANGREAEPVRAGETRRIDVLARFLYGAPGAGLTAQTDARVQGGPGPVPAPGGLPLRRRPDALRRDLHRTAETVTDGEGRAVFALDSALAGTSATPLLATLNTAVFEPGGRPVREGLTLKLRARPLYLGVKVNEAEQTGSRPRSWPSTLPRWTRRDGWRRRRA